MVSSLPPCYVGFTRMSAHNVPPTGLVKLSGPYRSSPPELGELNIKARKLFEFLG